MKLFNEFVNEKVEVSDELADKFIKEVLKLGSRDNLFDKFMKREKINSNELATFISTVVNRIKSNWL